MDAELKQFDVIIVGGGPAASMLAWRMPQDRQVLIVDRRFLLTPERLYEREKCCGGMLDETAQKALAKLGIPVPHEVLVGPQVYAIRAIDFDNQMEKYYQKKYVNICAKEALDFERKEVYERRLSYCIGNGFLPLMGKRHDSLPLRM